jgi:hypothetical protein
MSSDQPNVPPAPQTSAPPPTGLARPLPPASSSVRTAPPPMGGFFSDTLRSRLAPAALIVIVLVLWAILVPRSNPREQLATRVTIAIVNNDMRPVEKEFNAVVRPKLENRAKVGQLSQDLTELGKLKKIKEDTPSGAEPRYHHFQAQFEKGTWEEDMTFDADGKIASFHVHAPAANLGR